MAFSIYLLNNTQMQVAPDIKFCPSPPPALVGRPPSRLALQTPLPRPVPPCGAPPLGAPDGAGGAAGREGRAPLRFQPGGPAELSSPPLSTPLPVFSVQSFVEQGVCPARPSPSRETPARIHPSAGPGPAQRSQSETLLHRGLWEVQFAWFSLASGKRCQIWFRRQPWVYKIKPRGSITDALG